MYATINLSGSSHFEFFGPATRKECEDWLNERTAKLTETELITSLLPQHVTTNRDAESWKYLDGTKVIRSGLDGMSEEQLESFYGHKAALPCGCLGEGHYSSCPSFGLS